MSICGPRRRPKLLRQGQDFTRIERGRYLTYAADCAACHDDPYQNRPFAGGRPIETPFGVVVAPNITPDRETGIGGWSDAQFDDALRHGKEPDGKRLYPAMPFVYYTKMSHDDVLAIRAYLNTVPARASRRGARPTTLSFQHSRKHVGSGTRLYFTPGAFKPDPVEVGGVESWRVSGRGAGSLRGLPHAEDCPGRRQDERRT